MTFSLLPSSFCLQIVFHMIWLFLWQFPIIVSPMKWHRGSCYQLCLEPQLAHLDKKVHHLLLSADISVKHASCSRFGLDPRWPEQLDLPVVSVGVANAQYRCCGEESRQCPVCGCVRGLCFAPWLCVPEGSSAGPAAGLNLGKLSLFSAICVHALPPHPSLGEGDSDGKGALPFWSQ